MSPQRITLPAASARTQTLAEACIRKMTSVSQSRRLAPFFQRLDGANSDELNASGDIWLIDSRRRTEPPSSHYATAWPLWFGHQCYEKPLFYFVNTPSVDMLRGLEPETNRKGIFISDADTGSADLPKGVQAWFPLQLTAMVAFRSGQCPRNRRDTPSRPPRALSGGTRKMVYLATNADNGPSSGNCQAFKGIIVSPRQQTAAGSSVRRPSARPRSAGGQSVENWGLRLKSGVAPATRGWRRTPNSPTCSARTAAANAI